MLPGAAGSGGLLSGPADESSVIGEQAVSMVPMQELLSEARHEGYVQCYCEAWNLESFQAVMGGAEDAEAPVIAGFNGGFLCHAGRRQPERLEYYAALGVALRDSSVPWAFLLNESDDFVQIERGLELGFNAVMVENERLEMKEYRALVKKVVVIAHSSGVFVEAAVGHLADASAETPARHTEPGAARAFVEETGIDALAVAVGNVHILTQGTVSIDLERLEAIHAQVKIPLVLHGGTGISLAELPSYVRAGIAKINFGTTLKQAYLAAVRDKLAAYEEPMSPHTFLGMGGPEDILASAREAVKAKVKDLLTRCGATSRAGSLSKRRDKSNQGSPKSSGISTREIGGERHDHAK
jgi:fructose-bisphosphate aldolase, class II